MGRARHERVGEVNRKFGTQQAQTHAAQRVIARQLDDKHIAHRVRKPAVIQHPAGQRGLRRNDPNHSVIARFVDADRRKFGMPQLKDLYQVVQLADLVVQEDRELRHARGRVSMGGFERGGSLAHDVGKGSPENVQRDGSTEHGIRAVASKIVLQGCYRRRVRSDARAATSPLPTTKSAPLKPVLPREIVRNRWTFGAALVAIALVIVGYLQVTYVTRSLVMACLVIGGIVAMFCTLVFVWAQMRAAKAFLLPHAGFVCPVCHFGLHALPDETTCPECGTSVTRAGAVAMWERALYMRPRFPRTNRHTRGHVTIVPEQSAEVSPWQSWRWREALLAIEAGAALRGFKGVRLAPDPVAFDAPLVGKGKRPLPPEVYSLLAWADERQWRAFIAAGPAGTSDEDVAPSVTLRSSDRIRVLTVLEHAENDADLLSFLNGARGEQSAGWRETQLIAFADACDGRVIYFATDPPVARAGSIFAIERSRGQLVCLGEGMGQWLTRLAVCDGIDAALFPSMLTQVPERARFFLRKEFSSVFAGQA